ncbi:hypothetical protein FA10DRAFT_81013 [Acaromyces ingoldii]|uniref:Mis18 domain-containing protein n=1 Tax=Acaromyces ingoldii TaxID=215250 RepID=A0A316YRT7_9BASI|nr:hypothetical protein FA10DRAFT_81013 [Acaromyces ingoldii]PWN92019.1 hypothetical protein FA10DRAFT_81013 [Acaromyces ingoldii]
MHTHTRVRCQDAISRLKWPTPKPNSVLVTRRRTAMSLPSPPRDRPYNKRQHSRAADHLFEDDLRWWSDERSVERENQSRTEELSSSSRSTLRESQKLPKSTSSRTIGWPDHDARGIEPYDLPLQRRKKTRFALPEEIILQGEGTAHPRHAVGHRTASDARRDLEPRNESSRREGSSSHKYKGASPIVLSCARCRRILGDSIGSSGGGRDGVEGRDDEAQIRHDLGFVVLTRITPIVQINPDLQMVVEEHRPDVGSTFVALFCACGSRVGRKYWTTPKNLDSVRDRYALSIGQVSVYQLGIADSAERERPRGAWKDAAEASFVQPQASRGVHASPSQQQQRENKHRPMTSIVMQQGHVPPHMTARDPHDVPERHRVDFELDELIDELERSSDDNNDQDRRGEGYMCRPFKVAAPQVRSNASGNNNVKKEAPRSPSRVRDRNFPSPSLRRSEKDHNVSTPTIRKVKREHSLSPIRFRGYSSDDGSSGRETSKKGRENPKVRRLGSLKDMYD